MKTLYKPCCLLSVAEGRAWKPYLNRELNDLDIIIK
jgi:hypothetical protein